MNSAKWLIKENRLFWLHYLHSDSLKNSVCKSDCSVVTAFHGGSIIEERYGNMCTKLRKFKRMSSLKF